MSSQPTDETKCPWCGCSQTNSARWGKSYTCGTSTYIDGPSRRGEACTKIEELTKRMDALEEKL